METVKVHMRGKWVEMIAVLISAALKFILMDWLGLRLFYITGVCIFWIVFIILKYRKNHRVLKGWGLQREHFKASFLFLLPFTIASSAFIIIYGIRVNATFLNWHIIPILTFYPAWGLIQQFMMLGLISANLGTIFRRQLGMPWIILITGFMFALIHLPEYPLVIYAFFMEMLFTYAYFRWKNLWSLGLVHGWISGLLYFFVLGRDMWNELFMVF